MEEIEIIVEANGDTKVEGKGIVGPDCESLTKQIEEALGAVVSKRRTREYYEKRSVNRTVGR